MTTSELKDRINLILGEEYDASLLEVYIEQAQTECVNWEYQLIGISIRGAEGETQHSENGILRGYKYSDMRQYIHNHLIPYAKTL